MMIYNSKFKVQSSSFGCRCSRHTKAIHILVFLVILFSSNLSYAQEPATEELKETGIDQKIENIAENLEVEDLDFTNLLDGLTYFQKHPINLNHTNREQLSELQLLNEVQINNLLQHIERNGRLITIYELQSIDGFDIQTIGRIMPYVKVSDMFDVPHFSINEMLKNGQHAIMIRSQRILEDQGGFLPIDTAELRKSPNSRYLGSPYKLYTRYRFTYGSNVSWGITAENDAGEQFFKGAQKNGFDFYSAHLFIRNLKFIKAIAIGDYQVNFGQGLTAWSGLAFGKSADAMNIKKTAMGLRAYASVDENLFLRGAATTVGFKKFEFTAFGSRKKIDANVVTADTSVITEEGIVVSALQETGYHTIPSEIADKHAATQTIYGGNISYKLRRLKMGITAIKHFIDVDLQKKPDLYNQFELMSGRNSNVGFDYNYIYRNFNFFGEVSRSENGGIGYLNGAIISLDPKLALSILQRNYQKDYQAAYSNAFAESSRAANEKGIYIGINAKPYQSITLTAYYDQYRFPWLKYQVNAPSYGRDYLTQINYTPNKKTDMYFRIRSRDRFKTATGLDNEIDIVQPLTQTNYRFNISYPLSPSIRLKNRVELTDFKFGDNKTKKGYIVYQDVSYTQLGVPLSVSLRYALFDTEDYDTRIYAYENDMIGAYSIPAYYYKGSRIYILVDYNLTRNIEIWLRYSQTYYSNKDVISEGSLTEIQGNSKSEIKAQVRFRF